ncbi:MAG: methyltransferase domain-containing protein [Bradymonadales bacterium]|nr:methyltransferase domain-containing protein [Bradymonadales bacterium]
MDQKGAELVAQGWQRLEEGRHVEAIQVFSAVAERPDQQIEALHGRALARERQGALSEALLDCERVLERHGGHLGALMTKGSIHAARGERMAALDSFREAARHAPGRAAVSHLVASAGGAGFTAPLRAEVEELFDRYADRFDRHLVEDLGYQGHLALAQAVVQAAGTFQADWSCLELGCGTGLCGPLLRPLARRLTGVDLSSKMLSRARDRHVYDVLYRADLVYALVCSRQHSLDLVAASDVLSYLGDLRPVFEESARVLKPGGWLAFTVEAATGHSETVCQPTRRVAFSRSYIERQCAENRFEVGRLTTAPLRTQSGQQVMELIAVCRRA